MDEQEDECVTCGSAFDHFAESEELFSLIDALPLSCKELSTREGSQQRFVGKAQSVAVNHAVPDTITCCFFSLSNNR